MFRVFSLAVTGARLAASPDGANLKRAGNAMNITFSSIIPAAATTVLVCLAVAALPSKAQPIVETSGNYVLRASTVSAANLPDAMRKKHGIPTASNTAVLNVTVQYTSDGVLRNIPARLEVRARNLLGVETGVDMRGVVANDMVSYMGSYRFLPREVLDFQITAYPEGVQRPITLQFRDRLGRR